jgi:pantoate kinase
MPIGAGFGTSGAAALSLALALNKTFELGMTKTEAAKIAHTAEVECKTGLGTVIAEAFGGIEVRTKPGAPGIGEVRHIPAEKDIVVVCLSFGPLSTKKFLSDWAVRKRINKFGGKLLDGLVEEPSVANFMKFSRQFAEHVGLISDKLRNILKAADEAGFVCSMPMFGESIFTVIEKDSLPELLKIFEKHGLGGKTIVSGIDFEGARLLS